MIASYTYGICLENPRPSGYLTDDVGEGEAERNSDKGRHTEFEQGRKLDSPQRTRKKDHDWNMDNVDSIAMLRQEPAEPSLPVEKAAEEWDQAQAHANCENGVPERIYGRLPCPVTERGYLLGGIV